MQNSDSQARQPAFRSSLSGPSHTHQAPPSRGKRYLLLTGLVGVLMTGIVMKLAADAELAILDIQDRMIAAESTVPMFSGPKLQPLRVQKEINALITAHPDLKVSVSYKDLTTHKSFQYGARGTYTAASVGKLITASLLLHQVDIGKRTLSDTIGGSSARQLLKAMIEVSDNGAWLTLNTTLGYQNLEAYARQIGITDYDAMDNLLSAEDVAVVLQKLYNHQLLSKTSSDLLLNHMKAANYRQYIVAAVTDKSTVYHKVGFLDDRIHDAAVVDNGKYPYILVVFSEARSGSYNFDEGATLIHGITKSVHKTYLRKE